MKAKFKPDEGIFRLSLVIFIISLGLNCAAQTRDQGFKSLELGGEYSIRVPGYLSLEEVSNRIAPHFTYGLQATSPHSSTILISIRPYSFVAPIDPRTGLYKLPLSSNGGPPLTRYFVTPSRMPVYYGWSTADEAYDCTMNEACPHATPKGLRYETFYAFDVFDESKHAIVEFTARYSGPKSKVNELKGDAKLLHDEIVPSLMIRPN